MAKYLYPACFYKEDNGQYSVIFPDFGGATYGNDLYDAYNMAIDYLGSTIACYQDDGEQLPEPTDIKDVKCDEQPNGFVSLVVVDSNAYRDNRAVKKTLTIPAWLDRKATAQHVNFSAVLQEALKAKLAE